MIENVQPPTRRTLWVLGIGVLVAALVLAGGYYGLWRTNYRPYVPDSELAKVKFRAVKFTGYGGPVAVRYEIYNGTERPITDIRLRLHFQKRKAGWAPTERDFAEMVTLGVTDILVPPPAGFVFDDAEGQPWSYELKPESLPLAVPPGGWHEGSYELSQRPDTVPGTYRWVTFEAARWSPE